LVKLFWTAGVDDAASTVEEFIETLEDKRKYIGLDSFLRLYDTHENKMIAHMATTSQQSNVGGGGSSNSNNIGGGGSGEDSNDGKADRSTSDGRKPMRFVWANDSGNQSTNRIPNDVRERLQIVFDSYDMNNDGVISFVDLRTCFSQRGKNVPDSEIRRWIAEKDTVGDGVVTLDEFLASYGNLLHRGEQSRAIMQKALQQEEELREKEKTERKDDDGDDDYTRKKKKSKNIYYSTSTDGDDSSENSDYRDGWRKGRRKRTKKKNKRQRRKYSDDDDETSDESDSDKERRRRRRGRSRRRAGGRNEKR
jgi:hypothetical protein